MDDSYTGQSSGLNVDVYEKTTEEMLLAEMKWISREEWRTSGGLLPIPV